MFNKKKKREFDPMKEIVSEHLRSADKLVRLKRYDEALMEIENAYKIDPNNMYTRSFLERTRYMIEKENEKRSKVFGGEVDMTSEHRMETIAQLFASAEVFISEKKYHHALNALAKIYHIDPKNYYAQAFSDRIEMLMQTEAASKKIKPIQTPPSSAPEPDVSPTEKPTATVQHIESVHPATTPPPPSMPARIPAWRSGRWGGCNNKPHRTPRWC